MDNKDFYGYSRKVTAPGTALPAEFATLTLGGNDGAIMLLQSAQISYAHTVQPFFEIGSPDLYWVTGQPMGSAQIGRVVGQEGFLKRFGRGAACATVTSLSLGLKRSGGCMTAQSTGQGINMLNCMPEAVTISVQAGALQMQEGMTLRIGALQAAQ
jgi:hypothetical protein